MKEIDLTDAVSGAVQDAIVYGAGMMIVKNTQNGPEFAHVPRDDYTQLIEALRWQIGDIEGNKQ